LYYIDEYHDVLSNLGLSTNGCFFGTQFLIKYDRFF